MNERSAASSSMVVAASAVFVSVCALGDECRQSHRPGDGGAAVRRCEPPAVEFR